MLVQDIMTTDVLTVEANSPLEVAVETMLRNRVGSVIVTVDGDPTGIVTETDAMRAEYLAEQPYEKIPTRKVMSQPLVTVDPGATVRSAVQKMRDEDLKKLPVTEDFDMVGIVTVTDVAHHHPDLMREARHVDQGRSGWSG